MIGLKKMKRQVANQVQSFIVQYRLTGNPSNGEKLHTLILGPSGTGKTKLGKYLAELWASSGCLAKTTLDPPKLFAVRAEGRLRNSVENDALKNILRQNLAVKEVQLRQNQETIQEIKQELTDTLTLVNNVRKKVRARNSNNDGVIQSKFQEIKKKIKNVTTISQINNIKHQLLPVIIPKLPDSKSLFGSVQAPKLLESSDAANDKPLAKFVIITRGDLIGKFQGHTTDQLRSFLEEYVGGVIMIDEAYDLCTSTHDDFGKEALTEIINFMSTWPDKVVFIFAGYRKHMEETLLKFQPGLARRFKCTFDIEDYTYEELCSIFRQQLSGTAWSLGDNDIKNMNNFFKENMSKFPHFGGDTERLCTFVRETCNEQCWQSALDDNMSADEFNKLFTNLPFQAIQKAFVLYLENSVKEREDQDNQKNFDKVKHIYT